MKRLTTILCGGLFLLFTACGESGPSEAELAADAEAARVEALNEDLETSVEDVEEAADELVDALDSLDILFPEEQ